MHLLTSLPHVSPPMESRAPASLLLSRRHALSPHRLQDRELHEELEKLTDLGPSEYAYQLGGGCRIVLGGQDEAHIERRPISIASRGESVAAFEG